MTKTLSSITLLLLASGWLSLLPAETQTKYVCVICNKEFSSKMDESQRCPKNSIENFQRSPKNSTEKIVASHKFRTK